jgi:Flp pilus assembly protein TadG
LKRNARRGRIADVMPHRYANRQSGAAAIELIAALPLIALLVAALFQLAWAGYAQWRLQEAARLAARTSFVAARTTDESAAEGAARRAAVAALGRQGRTLRLAPRRAGDVQLSTELPLIGPYRRVLRGRPQVQARARFGQ